MLDGRLEIADEIAQSDNELRNYLIELFSEIDHSRAFRGAILGHFVQYGGLAGVVLGCWREKLKLYLKSNFNMKLAWLTDIHLNFLDRDARNNFYQEILNTRCDAILVSGDIAEAPSLVELLNEMSAAAKKPIYFVLGNHDYYRGQIQEIKKTMIALSKGKNQLYWLPASGIQILSNNSILVGQDGWADGRLGDYANSRVSLNDSRMIADLFQEKILGKFQLLEKMQQLADADAMQMRADLLQAVSQNPKKVIVLTHVPPFKEACMYDGKISGEDWVPYFSSKIMGDVLIKIAHENPAIEFLVLCGHTHGEAKYQPINNLIVEVGRAEYYQPAIQKIISV